MLSVYRTLSMRYLRQRWTRATLIVCSIALGVATLVATLSLNDTMDKAVQASANPLAGGADLMVSNGDSFLDGALANQLARVRGVRSVRPMLFRDVFLLDPKDNKERTVLMVGVDIMKVMNNKGDKAATDNPWGIQLDIWPRAASQALWRGDHFCVLGEELNNELDRQQSPAGGNPPARDVPVQVRAPGGKEPFRLTRVGTVTAAGAAAALGGNVLVTQMDTATAILGEKPGMVTRLDLTLEPGHDREKVRRRVQERLERLHSRAQVKTPEEQARSSQSVMAGMQAGFMLCGLGALVVGMFLVYNALSVSVTERRHEIGILRSLGATRLQIRSLFAGEAAILGLAGAVVGVPVGLGLAYLALEPMREVISGIFRTLEANRVEWTVQTVAIAVGAGMVTALLASLVPAFRASIEEPAVAVRRIPQNPTWTYRLLQVAISVCLMAAGVGLILCRRLLQERVGTYGGLVLVLLGALLATPLLAAVAARLVQPLARRFLGIEGRLGADNLVRAPARTGLVIAALAAGVSLVLQTAGTIRSNRDSVRDWVDRCLTADLVVSGGSPVSGGQKQLLEEDLGPAIQKLCRQDVRAVLPIRFRDDIPYRNTTVLVIAVDARRFYEVNRKRRPTVPGLDLYREISARPGTVLVSENFAALYGVKPDQTISLEGRSLQVLGQVIDYSWNHGTVIMDRRYYTQHFKRRDRTVNAFDVYLKPGTNAEKVQTTIGRHFGASKGVVVLTHDQLQRHIGDTIERLYAIAYGQQMVVGVVAALGVVTALLISVLQRRRELGVLRAIGASRSQVVRSVLAEAALMGVIGTVIGLLVGVPLEWYILQVLILEESGYYFPVTIPWLEAGVIAAIAMTVAVLAGLWPALNAVRQRIPEAIAHE